MTTRYGTSKPITMLNVSYFSRVQLKELIAVAFDAPKVNYERPSFFAKFWELQAVMWRTNAGLTDRHAYDSRPPSWPVMRRGIVSYWLLSMADE